MTCHGSSIPSPPLMKATTSTLKWTFLQLPTDYTEENDWIRAMPSFLSSTIICMRWDGCYKSKRKTNRGLDRLSGNPLEKKNRNDKLKRMEGCLLHTRCSLFNCWSCACENNRARLFSDVWLLVNGRWLICKTPEKNMVNVAWSLERHMSREKKRGRRKKMSKEAN